jgi:hypothetical protein
MTQMNHNICKDLLGHEKNNLINLLSKRSLILKAAVVQLLFATPNSRHWTLQHTGVACFIKDNDKRS